MGVKPPSVFDSVNAYARAPLQERKPLCLWPAGVVFKLGEDRAGVTEALGQCSRAPKVRVNIALRTEMQTKASPVRASQRWAISKRYWGKGALGKVGQIQAGLDAASERILWSMATKRFSRQRQLLRQERIIAAAANVTH